MRWNTHSSWLCFLMGGFSVGELFPKSWTAFEYYSNVVWNANPLRLSDVTLVWKPGCSIFIVILDSSNPAYRIWYYSCGVLVNLKSVSNADHFLLSFLTILTKVILFISIENTGCTIILFDKASFHLQKHHFSILYYFFSISYSFSRCFSERMIWNMAWYTHCCCHYWNVLPTT